MSVQKMQNMNSRDKRLVHIKDSINKFKSKRKLALKSNNSDLVESLTIKIKLLEETHKRMKSHAMSAKVRSKSTF